MHKNVVERINWMDQMMCIALWLRYRGLEGLGQFLRLSGSPVNVRIHQAQRTLTRTYRLLWRLYSVGVVQQCNRVYHFICCGIPVVGWRTPLQ